MLRDHLHDLEIILGCQSRAHQRKEDFPTEPGLVVISSECPLQCPLGASPPLAALICAVLLLPCDDDADSGNTANDQRHTPVQARLVPSLAVRYTVNSPAPGLAQGRRPSADVTVGRFLVKIAW